MKHSKILLTTLLLTGLLLSCSQAGVHSESSTSTADSPPPPMSATESSGAADKAAEVDGNAMGGGVYFASPSAQADSMSSILSSSAATGSPLQDTANKFIRTADVRFRVNNVRRATFELEKITAHYGGYVAHTGLESTINSEVRTKVSDDSTLITTYYTVSNNLVLRVPVQHLDSMLRSMGPLVQYLDYRRIHAENATLKILRERLEARRINRSTMRLEEAVDETQAKLRDRAAIEEALYNKQTMADESLIRTLELKDQIALSTINLDIYQRQDFTHEMVVNEKDISAFKPGFWHEIGQSISKGWEAVEDLIIALVAGWPLILFLLGVLLVVLYLRSREKKSKP